jgi:acetyltransferase-like isoleucine patch superfamily enzyme
MKKINRAALMLFFHFSRMMLKPVESLAPRLYMKIYLRLLVRAGLRLTGTPRYISGGVKFDDFSQIVLGDRVVISDKVILLTHDYSMTTALISLGEVPETDIALRKGIVVGNNVFIGMGAIILPGAEVGNNVIIGAGSVIRGKIQDDSLVLGNPASRVGCISELGERWRTRLGGADVTAD